jgi:hypothetical protein
VAIAHWQDEKLVSLQSFADHKKGTHAERAISIAEKTFSLTPATEAVYIEGVNVYSASTISQASATSGNLIFLTLMVGAMAPICKCNYGFAPIILDPRWKGQLPYPALREWVYRIINVKCKNDHEAAAVGMGLFLMGKL